MARTPRSNLGVGAVTWHRCVAVAASVFAWCTPGTVWAAEYSAPPAAAASPTPPAEEAPAAPEAWAWARPPNSEQAPITAPPVRRSEDSTLPWRESVFAWSHTATTTLLGVGQDYQSASYQAYEQGFAFDLRYRLIDTPGFVVHVQALPWFTVELTNSDSTTTRNEPVLADTAVGGGLGTRVHTDPSRLLESWLRASLIGIVPTARASRAAGHYLTVSPRVAWLQRLPLRGPGATFLDDLRVSLSARYDHLFSRATSPTDPELDYPRQDRFGRSGDSDALSGGRIAPNSLRFEALFSLEEEAWKRPLQAQLRLRYASMSLYGVDRTAIALPTSDAEPGALTGARTNRPATELLFEIEYAPTNVFSIALAYENITDLGAPSNNPLYTPNAIFAATLSVKLANLYEALVHPATSPSAASLAPHHY
jgi:hypothetical protein